MSPLPSSVDAVLNGASTVAIIVHGIGDHTSIDILRAAELGFGAVASEGDGAERLTIGDFPQTDGMNGPQEVLKIESRGRTHIVVPIVWSRMRARAEVAVPWDAAVSHLMGYVTLPLLLILIDAVRCIPKAATVRWKASIALAGFMLLVAIAGFIAGLFYILIHIPSWLSESGDWTWYGALLLALILISIRFAVSRILPLFDLVGDVVAYVARQSLRQEIQWRIHDIIDAAARRAPVARIIVIGHSLGSVAVAHALLGRTADHAGAGRTVLVTLGSPLNSLSRAFPAQVSPPDVVASHLANAHNVTFWVNAWRDCDFIGRELDLGVKDGFAERSLGDGPHWNMWGDPRLWRLVGRIHDADNEKFAAMKVEWQADNSIETDLPEIYVKALRLWLRRLIFVPLYFGYIAWGSYWGPAGPWFGAASATSQIFLRILSLTLTVLTVVFFIVSLSPPAPMDKAYLGALRRKYVASTLVMTILFFFSALFAVPIIAAQITDAILNGPLTY
jgi:hypothetical protein